MEAAPSTLQQSFGFGPRGPNPPHGPQQASGSHLRPPSGPRPEEQNQTQHKPFFYVQPPQPYLPVQSLQWPVPVHMPLTYNPYYGYPSLGYGMQMMPHYQPNPFMEPPSFVLPRTNLHLMDYRRILTPQYYHSLRFRYQQNGLNREMTSSEVQTEPLSAIQRTSTPDSSNTEASSSISVRRNHNDTSVPTRESHSPSSAVQLRDQPLQPKDMASSSTRTPPNGSFVIQTEEVCIECCTTPVGLQLLHSRETAEVSHSFSQDVVQRSSIIQGHVLQESQPCLPADQSEQAPQACPDILLVGARSRDEKMPALEESKNQTDHVVAPSKVEIQDAGREKDESVTSKNFQFNVVHPPFDSKYLDELRRMESTVWSMEDTQTPSPESLTQNGRSGSLHESPAAEVPSADVLTPRLKDTEAAVPMMEMPPVPEDDLEDMMQNLDNPGDGTAFDPDIYPPVAEDAPKAHKDEVSHVPYLLLLDNSSPKVERSQLRQETNIQDHQDTSFESLPAYLPSASWLADFDNVYYCSKMPPTPQKPSRPLSNHSLDVPSRRRKLDQEYKDQPTARKAKERYKPKGKVDRRSLSDHECCLSRSFNENTFMPYASKRDRLCSRCVSKRRLCTSKRKAFQQCNDALLPTCEACKSHSKNQLLKGSCHDVCSLHDDDVESSENSSSRKWRPGDDPRKLNDLKKPLASKQNVDKCPPAMHPRLREKNCVCNEPQHQPASWERQRHCPHGNAIREMDENCAVPFSPQDRWRNMNQTYLTHRWHTEKSWKEAVPIIEDSKMDVRSQLLNKHKKSQPQSQEIRRKDTRC